MEADVAGGGIIMAIGATLVAIKRQWVRRRRVPTGGPTAALLESEDASSTTTSNEGGARYLVDPIADARSSHAEMRAPAAQETEVERGGSLS